MTENVGFIDEVIYEELIKNNDMEKDNTERDPYYIVIVDNSTTTDVYIKKKSDSNNVTTDKVTTDKVTNASHANNMLPNDENEKKKLYIKNLNRRLNMDLKYNNPNVILFRNFLEKKKITKKKEEEERTENKQEITKENREDITEKSQESKQNSDRVQVGQIWKYKDKNGKTLRGVVSKKQGLDGELINDVTLEELIPQKGGKRKSKKSKKSKTRKNSRKTNRHRR